jgi:SAM-dependent methyltransferase
LTATIEISQLPLYWRVSSTLQQVDGIPQTLPFVFDVDERHGLLTQRRVASTLDILERIYSLEANVGYLQEGNELSKPYGRDFLEYLNEIVESRKIKSVLEIGCGGCTVLSALKDQGLHVKGIDSSPFAASEGQRLGVPVVQGFYPCDELDEEYDLIFCVDVMEHIASPVNFLRSMAKNLKRGGTIVVNVPDCTESIAIGDISMVIHQHLNYFETESLTSVVADAGYAVQDCRMANYGGSLYLTAASDNTATERPQRPAVNTTRALAFSEKAGKVLQRFERYVTEVRENGGTVGFYVPLRAFPYLSYLFLGSDFRIFDDTPGWLHKVFDGYPGRIENFEDLATSPTSHLVIMSLTFGEVIQRKIAADSRTSAIETRVLRDFQ